MKTILSEIKSYIILTIGLFIFSFGWTAFIIPSGIIAGGVGGIGTLIYYATGKGFPVGYSFFIINALLVLIALKILGRKFGVKTVFGIVISSLFLSFLQQAFPTPLVDDKFMAAIIGGILGGAGIGIAFTQGGSTGGTDIVAMIVNKYRNISAGRVILYLDIFIIASSYVVFKDIPTIVYGYVVMGVTAYVIDLVIEGAKQSVQLFIISKKYEEIADRIVSDAGRGISIIDGMGWYTKEQNKIVMAVVRKHETRYVFKLIKELDPNAFISMGTVMGVYGLGFDEIRG